jgi:ribosome-binding protein aMBF1 (putative translation factor)
LLLPFGLVVSHPSAATTHYAWTICVQLLIVRGLISIHNGDLSQTEKMVASYSEQDKLLLTDLGQRIRELRLAIGLSQEKLAFECELDRTYVGSVERGERNISVINLRKISVALNVTLPELLSIKA